MQEQSDYPIFTRDDRGNITRTESRDGSWNRSKFDENGNEILYETSCGFWVNRSFNSNNECVAYSDSDGYVSKKHTTNTL